MMQKRKTPAWFVGVFVLVVVLLAGEAAISIYRFDGPRIVTYYLAYLVLVGSLIGVLVWAVDRWCGRWFVLIVSLVITFLIFSLRLNFFGFVIEMAFLWYATLFVAIWAVTAWLASSGLRENRAPSPMISAFAVIVLAAPVIVSLSALLKEAWGRSTATTQVLSSSPGRDLPNGWERLVFKDKPNIYLLSFDSMIPADIAGAYLKIDNPSYYRLLPKLLKEVPNALMFEVPSLRALNSVMRLEQKGISEGTDAFTGGDPSVLSSIAQMNSYQLITGWPGHVPSWRRGPYVTELLTPKHAAPVKEYFLCEVSGAVSRKFLVRALFFCSLWSYLDAGFVIDQKELVPFKDVIADRALEVASSSTPSIFFSYVYDPIGHTSGDFDSTSDIDLYNYREHYRRQSEVVSLYVEEVVTAIRSLDNEAVIIIFGDHGAWLSRTSDSRDNPKFFYSDRHRVFMAVAQGGHACGHPNTTSVENEFFTPSRYLFHVFSCLAGHETVVNADFVENPSLIRNLFDAN